MSQAHEIEQRFVGGVWWWGVASVISGAVMMALIWGVESPTARFAGALGSQFFIWGAIDWGLAAMGLRGVRQRQASPLTESEEKSRLQKAMRTLKLNHTLDYIYIAIGLGLAGAAFVVSDPLAKASLAGHAAGVIVQGKFLLLLDSAFMSRLGPLASMQGDDAAGKSAPSPA